MRLPYWLKSRQGLRRKLCRHKKRGAPLADGVEGYVCGRCGIPVLTAMPQAGWVSGPR